MEGQSRCSHKYLLLQVWCSLLTVTMVVMAALLSSIKPKPTEDVVSTLRMTANPTVNPFPTPKSEKSVGSSLSYIELIKSHANDSWEVTLECNQCSLQLHNNSILCMEESFYFLYAQVTFTKHSKKNKNKYVRLQKNARLGQSIRTLAEGTFPSTTEGSVWVAKMVKLHRGDSVSLDITDERLHDGTFWGAFRLH